MQYTLNGAPLSYGAFTDTDGVQHPADVLSLWGDADLAAIGVARVAPSLAEIKAALCIGVDMERDRRISAGFAFAGKSHQSRPEDRENISGAATAALAAIANGAQPGDLRWHGGDADFAWISTDNSLVPMDAQTVIAFGIAAMSHKQRLIFEARQIKDDVMSAEHDAAAQDAAVWP